MINQNSNSNLYLYEIQKYVDEFIKNNQHYIENIFESIIKNNNFISIQSLNEELKLELKNSYIIYQNNNKSINDINKFLLYIINDFCKKRAKHFIKNSEYVCPGCLFFKQTSILSYNEILTCEVCKNKSGEDPKLNIFFATFARHSKRGFKCLECKRFIPQTLNNANKIFCPYLDCSFVGDYHNLKKMHHPSIQIDQKIISDEKKESLEKDNENISLIKDIIYSQIVSIPYISSNFTIHYKNLAYQAILNILEKYPEDMIEYLLYKSRSGGFQNKIFQEYIYLLEKSLPFSFKKGKNLFTINSLLDENIKIFDGISKFEGIVNDKLCIKNNTQEFYVGGRKSAITSKFYIGKLLDVIDVHSKKSLLQNVVEYSFSGIKIKNVVPGTKVIVSHLRVPPHYQMGGMSYINRARKKIVDRLTCHVDL